MAAARIPKKCPLASGQNLGNDQRGKGKECPRCGQKGSGPYLKRVGKGQFGLYFMHAVEKDGVRRTTWHYVPRETAHEKASKRREEELLRLLAKEGWKGTGYYACTLHVSERTIRRYVDRLCASGLLIHRRYGGYVADPTGEILKRNPWLAW